MMGQALRCSFVALLGSALLAAASTIAIADTPAVSAVPAATVAPAAVVAPAAAVVPPVADVASTPAPTPTPPITVPIPGAYGLTGTNQEFWFNGGSGDLGPWVIQALQYQWQQGKDDIPSVTLYLRQDHDVPTPTFSQAIYADDYHTWTPSFYTYAQVETSAGHVNPNFLAYLEGDVKFGKYSNYVFAVGGATMRNPDGATFPFSGATSTQYLSIGPSYYTGPFAFTLRFLPSDTNGTKTSSMSFTTQYTNVGHDQTVLTFLDGSQPNVFVGTPQFLPVYQYQHFTSALLTEKHWLTNDFGFVIGGSLAYYNGGLAPLNSYHQASVTYGLFYYPSH